MTIQPIGAAQAYRPVVAPRPTAEAAIGNGGGSVAQAPVQTGDQAAVMAASALQTVQLPSPEHIAMLQAAAGLASSSAAISSGTMF